MVLAESEPSEGKWDKALFEVFGISATDLDCRVRWAYGFAGAIWLAPTKG